MDHDCYRDVIWAHILGDKGNITLYRVISGDIGAISEDIGVISTGVKSVMYWARPIQVVLGQLLL